MFIWALLFNTARRNGHKPEFLWAEQNFPVLTSPLFRNDAYPAILIKKPIQKTYKKTMNIPLVNPSLKSVSCVPPPIGTGINEKSPRHGSLKLRVFTEINNPGGIC